MLACIPTEGNSGIADRVCGHFGSAPYFTLIDTETNQVTVLSNQNLHHEHGACNPMQALAAHPVDCVICTGMGRNAVEKLMARGITLFRAPSASVEETLAGLKAGDLSVMDLRQACAGHDHRH